MDGFFKVPNTLSNFWKADWVQITKRPTCPPGASFNRFSLSTLINSIPGMLRNALRSPKDEKFGGYWFETTFLLMQLQQQTIKLT